ncbi:MAG: CPBP family glutamic-type intramembrane protease [Polyangiaceae bacterium]
MPEAEPKLPSPRQAIWAWLLGLALLQFAGLVLVVAAAAIGSAEGLKPDAAWALLTDPVASPLVTSPTWIAANIVLNEVALFGLMFFWRRRLSVPLRVVVPMRRFSFRALLGAMLLPFGFAPLAEVFGELTQRFLKLGLPAERLVLTLSRGTSTELFVLTVASVALLPALVEEAMFRGFVTASFQRFSPLVKLLVPSLMFGVFHLEPAQVAGTSVLGVAFGLVRLYTSSIWPCMLSHFVYNAGILMEARWLSRVDPHVISWGRVGFGLGLAVAAYVLLVGDFGSAAPAAPAFATAAVVAKVLTEMLNRVKDRLLGGAAGLVDKAATLAVEAGSRAGRGPRIAVSHAARMAFLERVAAEYPESPSLDFFPEPSAAAPTVRRVSHYASTDVFDVGWSSNYVPYLASYAERYLQTRENGIASARLFRRRQARPVVVIVHGYMSGKYAIEERMWPLAELDAQGFDVALFVLPFHAARAGYGLVPEFPSNDPRMNIEGFRQAVTDLRTFVRALRHSGHPLVGLMGMSLGAYTTALTACIEPELAFWIGVVPLASLVDFASEQGSLSENQQEAARERDVLDCIYRPVSPFSWSPLVAPENTLVIGARADRVTPIAHARRLATHLGAPLIAFKGGHLLQVGRRESFERVYSLLERVRTSTR